MNAFEKSLANVIREAVRKMPDEAILDMVRDRLNAGLGGASAMGPQAAPDPGLLGSLSTASPFALAALATGSPAAGAALPRAEARTQPPGRRPAPSRRGGGNRGTWAPVKTTGKSSPAERFELLLRIERLVGASKGLAASEVARGAGVSQTRAAAALKELKRARRVFQGGDRRFARYAGDAATAQEASDRARNRFVSPRGGDASMNGKRGEHSASEG
jgi:hypothetical protein